MTTKQPLLAAFGKATGALLLSMILSGCGSLTVSMDVLNPQVIQREIDSALIAKSLPKLMASSDETIRRTVSELRGIHRRGVERVSAADLADAAQLSGALAQGLQVLAQRRLASFDRRVKPFYAALEADLLRYRQDLLTAMAGRYRLQALDAGYLQVIDILRTWDQRLRIASADIQSNLSGFTAPGELLLPEMQSPMLNPAEKALIRASIDQITLQDSPLAYAVANADEKEWTTRYNKVIADGKWGASDIAIRLDPKTGNYLLKGLSFDPSDVATMASKVTTQALLLTAQVAGVPVKTSATPAAGTDGKALATSSSALADAQAGLLARQAYEQARKAALLAIANVICNEEADIADPSDERRATAVKAIRAVFVARRNQLRPPVAP